jgi:hypothetical protein
MRILIWRMLCEFSQLLVLGGWVLTIDSARPTDMELDGAPLPSAASSCTYGAVPFVAIALAVGTSLVLMPFG